MFTEANNPDVWWLGHAARYATGSGRATFGGPPPTFSTHAFWWHRKDQAFVMSDHYGVGGRASHRAPMPLEAAGAFLVRCIDLEFNVLFLAIVYPSESAEETICTTVGNIGVSRGDNDLPGLTINFVPEDKTSSGSGFTLFSDLRRDFGKRLLKLSADEVLANLRAP